MIANADVLHAEINSENILFQSAVRFDTTTGDERFGITVVIITWLLIITALQIFRQYLLTIGNNGVNQLIITDFLAFPDFIIFFGSWYGGIFIIKRLYQSYSSLKGFGSLIVTDKCIHLLAKNGHESIQFVDFNIIKSDIQSDGKHRMLLHTNHGEIAIQNIDDTHALLQIIAERKRKLLLDAAF
jgi:hypothetical protein